MTHQDKLFPAGWVAGRAGQAAGLRDGGHHFTQDAGAESLIVCTRLPANRWRAFYDVTQCYDLPSMAAGNDVLPLVDVRGACFPLNQMVIAEFQSLSGTVNRLACHTMVGRHSKRVSAAWL
jgi:hypothetical protein